MAVCTDDARHSGDAPAASSKNADTGAYFCGARDAIASGFSGESRAISSAFLMARWSAASSNSAVVTVPDRLPKLDAMARLYPELAPDVVAVLRANLRFARSPPVRVTVVSSALQNDSARSVSVLACSRVQIIWGSSRVQGFKGFKRFMGSRFKGSRFKVHGVQESGFKTWTIDAGEP